MNKELAKRLSWLRLIPEIALDKEIYKTDIEKLKKFKDLKFEDVGKYMILKREKWMSFDVCYEEDKNDT